MFIREAQVPVVDSSSYLLRNQLLFCRIASATHSLDAPHQAGSKSKLLFEWLLLGSFILHLLMMEPCPSCFTAVCLEERGDPRIPCVLKKKKREGSILDDILSISAQRESMRDDPLVHVLLCVTQSCFSCIFSMGICYPNPALSY